MPKKWIAAFIFILVASCAGCGVADTSGVSEHTVSEGLAVLRKLQSQDISSVQDKFTDKNDSSKDMSQNSSRQSRDLSDEEIASLNFREIFSDSVIMGDSIAHSIIEYDFLTNSQVVAEIGISVSSTDDQIEQAAALNPQTVFLTYGLNDMDNFQGDYEKFRTAYDKFLTKVEEAMPDAQIYVNLIFPTTEGAVSKDPYYGYVDEYNAIKKEVCDKHGIPYFDNSDLAKEEYYEPDGIHFKSTFYPFWLYRLARESGLV